MPKKTVNKSAKTGQMVSEEFAEVNPDTTYETKVEVKPKAKKQWMPEIGEKFLLEYFDYAFAQILRVEGDVNDFVDPDNYPPILKKCVAVVNAYEPVFDVTIHEVINGCQTERKWGQRSFSDCALTPLSKEEAFRMLA